MDEKTLVVLVLTHSRKGFTDNMAKAIADGVETVFSVDARIKRVNEVRPSDLAEADGLAVGSPAYLGYITGELKNLVDNSYYKFHKIEKTNRLKGKPAAAFVSGRYKGYRLKRLQFRSRVLKDLERLLFHFLKMEKAVDGIHLIHNISGRDPRAPLPLTPRQAALCRNLGERLALRVQEIASMSKVNECSSNCHGVVRSQKT